MPIRLLIAGAFFGLMLAALAQADGDPPVAKPPPPLFPLSHEFQLSNARVAFDEARTLMLENYYSPALTEEELYQAAILGMLRHISPPDHPELARLWSAEQYARVLDSLKGVGSSVGFKSKFNPADGSLTVTHVDHNAPADGILQVNDRIMRIDGKRLNSSDAKHINEWLSKPPGQTIDLTVVRDIEVLRVTLVLSQYETRVVTSAELPRNVGYLRLDRVTTDISKQVAEVLTGLRERGIESLVIDLRDNHGGIFVEGLRLAELFLQSKSILGRTLQNGADIKTYVSANDKPFQFDVVVLISKQTASAAEVFTAAMQSHGAATVVGNSSFGKATMERTFTLTGGARVKFIIGALYDPRGRTWYAKGLKPDYLARDDASQRAQWRELSADRRLVRDTALLTAWKLLRRSAHREP